MIPLYCCSKYNALRALFEHISQHIRDHMHILCMNRRACALRLCMCDVWDSFRRIFDGYKYTVYIQYTANWKHFCKCIMCKYNVRVRKGIRFQEQEMTLGLTYKSINKKLKSKEYKTVGWLVFYGVVTLVGYLMPNTLYTHTHTHTHTHIYICIYIYIYLMKI